MLLKYCVECGKHRDQVNPLIIPVAAYLLPFKALLCDRCLVSQAATIKPHFKFTLTSKIVPKARPRVTKNATFFPKNYNAWRKDAAAEVETQLSEEILSHIKDRNNWTLAEKKQVLAKQEALIPFDRVNPVAVFVNFYGSLRGNSDIDNAIGAILDMLVRDKDGWCLTQDTVQRVSFIQARFFRLPKATKKKPQTIRTEVEVYALTDDFVLWSEPEPIKTTGIVRKTIGELLDIKG